MAVQEKLAKEISKLDKKLENLVNECLENDLNEEQVYRLIEKDVCERVSKRVRLINRTRNVFKILKIFLITLGLTYLLTRTSFTTDLMKMMGRKMLINIQPIFDWTQYYETDCLIKNRDYVEQNGYKNIVNCNLCESASKFDLIDNSNDLQNLTDLIINQRPVKISKNSFDDQLTGNPILSLTFEKLIDFYSNLDANHKVCMFESNLNFNNLFDFTARFNEQYLPVYAHWENCGYELRKKMRILYEIPNFMPMMLEFSRSNWFLISFNNYKTKNLKIIDISTSTKLAVLIQINGSNIVRLTPKENCIQFGCSPIDEQLNKGQISMCSEVS